MDDEETMIEDETLELNDDEDATSDTESGYNIIIPKLKDWQLKDIYNYSSIDYETLEELAAGLTRARRSLFVMTENLIKVERKERAAKLEYERAYRRAYLEAVGKTEAEKKERAMLSCEKLENKWVYFNQLKSELVKSSNSMRLELQTLQAIGNNIRQQMKVE